MSENIVLLENEQVACRKASHHGNQLCQKRTLVFGELLGQSPAVQELRNRVRKVACTDATVLLRGESGTGKSFTAGQIVRQGFRAGAPFIQIDCTTVSDMEAGKPRPLGDSSALIAAQPHSWFEWAQGGTLLLEEVGALPLSAQAALLEVLHKQQGAETSEVNVRLMATTNRPLEAKARRGEFREDLLHALEIVPIQLLPLRERREDIPVLAEHFRRVLAAKHGLEVLAIAPACLEALLKHEWPGNVRELKAVVERAVLACRNGLLSVEHFEFTLPVEKAAVAPVAAIETEDLGEAEKKHIFTVLERCHGNRTHAAKRLGISIRTLRNKLREYRQQAEQANVPVQHAA